MNNYIRLRGIMSVSIGIIASLTLFIGLYMMYFGSASQMSPISDVLLLFAIFNFGPAIIMLARSPFISKSYTIKYTICNIISSIIFGIVGFQILTASYSGGIPTKIEIYIIAFWNIFYILFQICAYKRLRN